MTVLTRRQVRNLDRIAVERFAIPGLVLMENAGRGATDFLLRRFSPDPRARVLIVAGRGNNGGDGFVIARHLALRGWLPELAVLGDPADFRGTGDAGVNFRIVERMALPIHAARDSGDLAGPLARAALIVDAVLGTGLSGEVRGLPRAAIGALDAASPPILAVDTPSGLDCDTGRPLGVAVRATATVTFAAMKAGFTEPCALAYTGEIEVADIGAPLVWE